MTWENAFEITGWIFTLVVIPPMFGSAMLSLNPWLSYPPKGFFYKYTGALHSLTLNRRQLPFGVPVIAWILGWGVAAGSLVVPTYVAFHDGAWTGHFVALVCSIGLAGISSFWMPSYFAPCKQCSNVVFIQFLATCFSGLTFVVYVGISTAYAMLVIPMFLWNFLSGIKVYYENQYACSETDVWSDVHECSIIKSD